MPRTGEILWDIPATVDTGRAASGDIDPRHAGAEGWAIGGDAAWNSPVGQLKSSTGELIAETIPAANFLAWFDGDPLREIVDHDWDATTSQGIPTVSKWNWETSTSEVILRDEGARSNNSTKGTPNLQADLFGDWREEIAWRSADSSELRIYSTTDETDLRIRTLMHDPVYRLVGGVAEHRLQPAAADELLPRRRHGAAAGAAHRGDGRARPDRRMPRRRSSRESRPTARCCPTAARSRWPSRRPIPSRGCATSTSRSTGSRSHPAPGARRSMGWPGRTR